MKANSPCTQTATLPARMVLLAVRAYQVLLSPMLGQNCRYEPSCSSYTMQAVAQHGALAGLYLGAARIGRCNPWCAGGHDPVPAQVTAPALFRHLRSKQPSSEVKS